MDMPARLSSSIPDESAQQSAREQLLLAYRAQSRRDWTSSAQAAAAALEADPALVAGYTTRALARRVMGDLDGAIADYTTVVERLDPGNAEAWEFRGATRSSLAAGLEGEVRLALLALAEQDYLRAKELNPQEDRLKLSLIETALCCDRPLAALAHAGDAWGSLHTPDARVIAAWLGSLAALGVEGLPRRSWQAYRKALRVREVRLCELQWSVIEVNGWLRRLETRPPAGGAQTMGEMFAIHELFLSHFERGPLLS